MCSKSIEPLNQVIRNSAFEAFAPTEATPGPGAPCTTQAHVGIHASVADGVRWISGVLEKHGETLECARGLSELRARYEEYWKACFSAPASQRGA